MAIDAKNKVNKFKKNLTLSNKEIKGKRADFITDEAQEAQTNLINEIKTKRRELERTLLNLEDLSPDSTQSLRPTKDGFNGKEWVTQLQRTKVALETTKVELRIAEETSAEYFGE